MAINEVSLAQPAAPAMQYCISLDAAGGEVSPAEILVSAGDTYVLPTPTRFGYQFSGWYLDETLIASGDPVAVTQDCTFVAQWLETGTVITLDAAGGSGVQTGIVIGEDGLYSLPTPVRTGYIFDGWYLDETLIPNDGSVPITEDCTLTAHWRVLNYTVIYHGNGGTANGLSSIQREYIGNQKVSLDSLGFTRPGYGLSGWRTSPNASQGIFYSSLSKVCDLTTENGGVVHLYAQ